MKAIPETFDMAKRMGLLIWISRVLSEPIPFGSLFRVFQQNHERLTERLADACLLASRQQAIPWAFKKLMLGIPHRESETSFSKNLRVGHGLRLYNLRGSKMKWMVEPNWMTWVIKKLPDTFSNPFRLDLMHKLLLFRQLLAEDDMFIIPLVRSLYETPLHQKRWIRDISFDSEFTEKTLSFMKLGYNLGLIKNASAIFLRRMRFFEYNSVLLKHHRKGTRGLLHMIEPRVHWFLDLSLVHPQSFLEEGIIKPGTFWEPLRSHIGSPQEYERNKMDVIDRYLRYHFDYRKTRETLEETTNGIIGESVGSLRSIYRTMIPIEAVLRLSWTRISVSQGKLVSEQEIASRIEKKYKIYRDWRSGLGFIDARNR